MSETVTLPDDATITETVKLVSLNTAKKYPGNVLKPHNVILDTPSGQAVVETNWVYSAVAPPPPAPGSLPNVPSTVKVGALLFDGSANGWAAFSRQRGNGGSMNGVKTTPAAVTIDAQNVAHLSLLAAGGGYMSTFATDGGGGYMIPPTCIVEFDAAVPLTAWNALWTVGNNWPAGGEEDVIEILGGTDTSNYHATNITNNSGTIGVQSAGRRTYTLVRGNGTDSVYWAGQYIRSYQTFENGAPQGIIMNVGQGTVGTVMDVYECRVWA